MSDELKIGADKTPVTPEKKVKSSVKKASVTPKVQKESKESKTTSTPKVTNTVSNEFQEKADKFFEDNPKAKEVFISADGFLFTNRNFACNHATTLENKEPFHFKNPTLLEVVADIEE